LKPFASVKVNATRLIVTYLAAERSMPPFLPGSPALPPESRWRLSVAERDGCSGARLALGRHLRNGEKAAVARCWDCCHFSAPHRGGPERAAPNILNIEKVFTVF